jgi:dTDP-4-dehydrorhamnose reductase
MSLAGHRVLVTGAAGLLGHATVLHAAAEGADVIACVHRQALRIPEVRSARLDVRDVDAVRATVLRERPSLVVHAAAIAAPDVCEADEDLALQVNVTAPRVLAQACASTGASLVHISSDAVYGEGPAPFTEQSVARGRSVYARSKLLSEQAVLEELPAALVLRTNFFGWTGSGGRSLAEFFHSALADGRPVTGFTDVRFTPLYVRDFVELIGQAVERRLAGIRNLGSATPMSKFGFGRTIAEVFGFEPELVRPGSRHAAGLRAVRNAELSMDSSRIAGELDVALPTTAQGVARMFADYQDGLPATLRAHLLEPDDEGTAHELQDR